MEGLKQDKREIFLKELCSKLEKSEEEYQKGKIHNAKDVFKRLREKYGY